MGTIGFASVRAARPRQVRPYVGLVLGLMLAIGLSIVERLDAALSTMHRVGDVAATFTGLASPGSLWSAGSAQELLRAWRDWDADRLAGALAPTVMSVPAAAGWFALLDTLLVAVPAGALLWLLSGWARDLILSRARDRKRLYGLSRQSIHDRMVRARALCQVSLSARQAALVYVALDALENLIAMLLARADTAPTLAVRLLGLVSLFKLLFLAGAAVPLLLVGLATRDSAGQWVRIIGRHLVALRGQVIVVLLVAIAFLAIGGDIGSQVDDVVMRWGEQLEHAVAAVLAALVLTGLLASTGYFCHSVNEETPIPSGKPMSIKRLLAWGIGGAFVAMVGLGLALFARLPIGYPLVFPGTAAAVFAALSARKAVRAVKPPAPPVPPVHPGCPLADNPDVPRPGPKFVPLLVWILAATPLAALGLVMLRTAVTLAMTREAFFGLGVLGALLILAAGILAAKPARRWPAGRELAVVTNLCIVSVSVAIYAVWDPMSAGDRLGTVALLLLGVIVLLLILTALHWAGDATAPRGAMALLRLRRMPFITLAVLWFAFTSLIDRTTHYHDVRLGAPLPHGFRAVMLDEAFTAWLDRQHTGPLVDGKQRTPMLFIATAGGGIRSAYWTGLILNCLFSPQPIEPRCAGQALDKSTVFAASGISGGSLGLAVDRAVEDTGADLSSVLARDFLSPDVAALAFRDIPNYLLRLQPDGADRAAVLEQAWESAMGTPENPLSQGFFAGSRESDGSPRFPLLLLNSATIDDGCRLNGSTLDVSARVEAGPVPPAGTEGCLTLTPFEPGREDPDNPRQAEALAGSKDLFQFLCRPQQPPQDTAAPGVEPPVRYDIPLSAAAHLSARFPYISPTGALTSCTWPQRRTYALDGGLLEGAGVSPLTEIWAKLAGRIHEINNDPNSSHCIEPRLLMIDNGYVTAASISDGGRPDEVTAPATGLSRFSGTWGARAEQAAALAFDHAFHSVACRGRDGVPVPPQPVQSRVAHIVPTAHPGPQAPLGWSLSRFARSDLITQARSPANMCQVALVRSWLSEQVPAGGMRCVTGFAVRAAESAAPMIARLAPPIETTRTGVAGVRISAASNAATTQCARGTTTDASGRFFLLLPADSPATLTICWAGTSISNTIPPGDTPLITSSNFSLAPVDLPPVDLAPVGLATAGS